ncbi:MAG TPA: hypothetical protein VN231_13575 [Allosphingosinicella sp.]|nr:hypothetical protein [Allosphingosinicella sp.]
MKPMKSLALLAAALAVSVAATPSEAPAQTPPNPILYLLGLEYYNVRGTDFVRYRYDVMNKASYPAAMFAPAPNLPPCGTNTNSSRTWVDFFDKAGQRLYGFCALGSPNSLGSLWFALPEGQVPPSWVYIVMTDRQTNTTYRSNLAETTP